jgi:hypothetical protein
MAEQNAHALEIRVIKFTQDIEVYGVVRKNCGVLPEADLIEPDRNRTHDT